MSDRLIVPSGMSRRHFLGHMATTAMAVPAMQFAAGLEANAQQTPQGQQEHDPPLDGRRPRHMDTWDLKPDSEKNGGEFKPIATSAPGVMISEHMPTVAKQMKHLNVIRSLNSKEGNHDRGTYMMHTGYAPNPTVVHPAFGSVLSYELGEKLENFDLPHCISINSGGEGAGFLGMAHSPFVVNNPNGKIANLEPPKEVDRHADGSPGRDARADREQLPAQSHGQGAVDHKAVYAKTLRMMNSRYTKAFNLDDEPAAVRDAYGRGSFGSGCLMARRLVEAGVTYVEVSLGGWDTHADAFNTLKTRLQPELDKGMGNLVADLAQRGLLDNTMIVWMGDFGRTPRINQNGGRDHWPRSWSVVMGGGGLKGGQAIGATDKDGVDIVDQPVGVMDLVATMSKGMGIDVATQYTTPRGRPIKVVDGGTPIPQLFA